MSSFGRISKMLSEGRVGFLADEVMTGTHSFKEGVGPEGELHIEFHATWGHKRLSKFVNPLSKEFFKNSMTGTVTVEGLVEETEMEGSLTLAYFSQAKLIYDFNFRGPDGTEYNFYGEKRDLRPWNLHKTHTTLYGTITERDSGRVISESVLHFLLKTAPAFLLSFRLA